MDSNLSKIKEDLSFEDGMIIEDKDISKELNEININCFNNNTFKGIDLDIETPYNNSPKNVENFNKEKKEEKNYNNHEENNLKCENINENIDVLKSNNSNK
jgi:hypothetical protein